MRTIMGATALPVAGCVSMLTMAAAHQAPAWLIWVGGGLAMFFLIASVVLLRAKRAGHARRWPVVVGALSAGLIGLVLGIITSHSGIEGLGDQYVYNENTGTRELRKGGYELNVRLFRQVVYQQTGPAVTRNVTRGTFTGPSSGLAAA